MNLTLFYINKILNVKILIFVLGVFIFSSCITQKKIEYLHVKNPQVKEYINNTFEEYILRPNDELFIQISSFDDASNFMNNSGNQTTDISNPFGASLMAHTIDKDGYLELPVVGKILVKDKNIMQVKDLLRESLVNVLNQPIITVKMVNKYISVLGEVNLPGHFPYSQEKLTIFDALSLAGDITEFGNKKVITLLRNTNGKTIREEINLRSTDILLSEYYYVQPNDIIYVKSLRGKLWTRRTGNISLLLAVANIFFIVLYRN